MGDPDAKPPEVWSDLEAICGSDEEGRWPEARGRIVAFAVRDDKLLAGECCDDYFVTELNAEEVDKLIAWLTEMRAQL